MFQTNVLMQCFLHIASESDGMSRIHISCLIFFPDLKISSEATMDEKVSEQMREYTKKELVLKIVERMEKIKLIKAEIRMNNLLIKRLEEDLRKAKERANED